MDILEQIVEKRKEDIAKLGYDFGLPLPKERKRKIVPFVVQKSVILEIKRASPSKGDIAPSLDPISLAQNYRAAGAKAISVLTENHYFKGSLTDLCRVSEAISDVSILRKDFILNEAEIDIAYRCGADAVLLISRILDEDKMVSMAKHCASLGLTAFIEVRLEEDLQKLKCVASVVPSEFIVCGVNSRDLSDFSIDLLRPEFMFERIKNILGKDARVVFESGILSAQAAQFAGSLGFTGLLLGEAAAKNPQNAKDFVLSFTNANVNANANVNVNALFWKDYANLLQKEKKPILKICGLTNIEDALSAAVSGAAFLGCIFYAKSPRNCTENFVRELRQKLNSEEGENFPKIVGVVVDCTSLEAQLALKLLKEGILDAIQLHGKKAAEEFFAKPELNTLPHYITVNVKTEDDLSYIQELRRLGEPRILLDSQLGEKIGGTGVSISSDLVKKASKGAKLWLAGGISLQNIEQILNYSPELIDVNSGIESVPGKKDMDKMLELTKCLESLRTL